MKKKLLLLALACTASVAIGADIGVSVSVGQPGFYGQIDIGDYPQPQLLYRQPIYVDPYGRGRPPIYMHVPPGHAKNWRKHCQQYNACGERVYFVQDQWYQREYVPRHQERHGGPPHGRGDDHRDDRRDDRRDDHREDRGDGDRGNNGNHGHKR
jgi:hypothetical protein